MMAVDLNQSILISPEIFLEVKNRKTNPQIITLKIIKKL
jgi:hypothetical protein